MVRSTEDFIVLVFQLQCVCVPSALFQSLRTSSCKLKVQQARPSRRPAGRNKGNSHSADSISACLNLTQQHFRFNLDGVPAAPVSSSQVSSRRAGQFTPLVHTSSPPPLSRCSLVSSSVSYCLSVSFTSSCCVLSISSAEQIHQV